jgi:hypothetical protein
MADDATGKAIGLGVDSYFYDARTLLGVLDWCSTPPMIPAADLVKAMTSGGKKHAPGLVVLAGCRSFDLAASFKGAGSKYILGFQGNILAGDAADVAMDFMKLACSKPDGEHYLTLYNAYTQTHNMYRRLWGMDGPGGLQPWDFKFMFGPGANPRWTLQDLLEKK